MKIASYQSGLKISSVKPSFNYYFEEADEPIEVEEKHAKKLLQNDNFYESDKPIKLKKKGTVKIEKKVTWLEEVSKIKGIDANEVFKQFPEKGKLLKELSEKKELPFDKKTIKKLNEALIH